MDSRLRGSDRNNDFLPDCQDEPEMLEKEGARHSHPLLLVHDETERLDGESEVNHFHCGFVVGLDGFAARLDRGHGLIDEEFGRGDLARVEGGFLIFTLEADLLADRDEAFFLVHGV